MSQPFSSVPSTNGPSLPASPPGGAPPFFNIIDDKWNPTLPQVSGGNSEKHGNLNADLSSLLIGPVPEEPPLEFFIASLCDLIPPHLRKRTAATTAGSLFSSTSVPQGDKSPTPPKRRHTHAEVFEFYLSRKQLLFDNLATSMLDAASEGREMDSRFPDWLERMQGCGKGAYFMRDPKTGRDRIQNFQRCGVRICPICMWRNSLRYACKYAPRIERFMNSHPTHRLRFLTLTDRPVPMSDFAVQCDRLKKGFRRLYHELSYAFVGYLRTIDIDTCARDSCPQKTIHDHWEAPMEVRPHIHAIMVQRPKNGASYVKATAIQQAWTDIMGAPALLGTHITDVAQAFGAVKYTTKGINWKKAAGDYNYFAAMAEAMDGERLTSLGGVLRGSTYVC